VIDRNREIGLRGKGGDSASGLQEGGIGAAQEGGPAISGRPYAKKRLGEPRVAARAAGGP